MHNILKLSITLTVVAIMSASLLTYVHGVTAPIIAERQEREYRQALELFFPDFESFETERYDNDYFDLIYDRSGQLIGVMATVQQQGYDGAITYNLAVDGSGIILGLEIISHSETPGIGDVITTDSFKGQFTGKSYEDPIMAGEDIDIVSGATVSTAAVINSVRRVIGVIAENIFGQEAATLDINDIPDGIYQGSAPGLVGMITVAVEVKGGKITSIEVLEHSETPTYFIEAYPLIPERIIAEQSLDIDTKTGATASSQGIVDAVHAALTAALEDNGGGR